MLKMGISSVRGKTGRKILLLWNYATTTARNYYCWLKVLHKIKKEKKKARESKRVAHDGSWVSGIGSRCGGGRGAEVEVWNSVCGTCF